MPVVSINILTKNRAEFLQKALESVGRQSFTDYEVVLVDDASTDETSAVLEEFARAGMPLRVIRHKESLGITQGRKEALEESNGIYIACLDDDDEWIDARKLEKQVRYFKERPEMVLVGGGMEIRSLKSVFRKYRPQNDWWIRATMLFRNNFFTSTVMFRRDIARKVGGFVKDDIDLTEDYDLWLRLGRIGRMHNFPDIFARYRASGYNKDKFRKFLAKQLRLTQKHKNHYFGYFLAVAVLKVRILLGK